ncbi:MAG TPA: glutathione S-transferase [Alphaproteobacteria bacterium]|nr:glutathione S-transferase [Alphaproteobacteria bacterium]
MRLRYSPTSPFVRKVMAVALETGLAESIDQISTNVWSPDTDIQTHNPLGKVPALITEEGEVLYDSPVICEYLDSLHEGAKLFPPVGGARWTALRRQALGDGMIEAAVTRFLEERRPESERSETWTGRQKMVIARALDGLEEEADELSGDMDTMDIGKLTIGVALGYLDFRFAGDDWRSGRGRLADWFEGVNRRPSMSGTVPKNPS